MPSPITPEGSRGSGPGRPDLLVIGGGPAGLALAIRARQRGMSVRLLDRARPPRDKACGEGLMPDALDLLKRLGVPLDPRAGRPFRGIRYVEGGLRADGTFPGQAHGLGLRRIALHEALVRRAEDVGVQLRWGVGARGLADEGGAGERVAGVGVETDEGVQRADWVAGADGLRSRVRGWAGLEREPAARPWNPKQRYGVRRHFRIEPWTDLVEVHWSDGCEAYVTPVGDEEVGVALLWSGRKGGFEDSLARFPALERRLRGRRVVSKDRGSGPFRQAPRGVCKGRLALVGDAAGYLDPITGEGLALALHQAFALIEAIEAGSLKSYPGKHRRISRVPNTLTATMLFLERRGALRRRVIRMLAEDPQLFANLLGVHSRALSLGDLGVSGAFRLIRGLASASA